jgi:hypothetical protein
MWRTMRIAELEAENATLTADEAQWKQMFTDTDKRCAELEALNAHLRREYSQLARPQATGIVVDDAMVKRALDVSPFSGDSHIRRVLTAAITSATLVPLASAEPVKWMAENGYVTETQASVYHNIPLYRGVRDGE